MFIDGRNDPIVDEAPDGIPHKTLLIGEQIVDAVEVHSSKRHNTPGEEGIIAG